MQQMKETWVYTAMGGNCDICWKERRYRKQHLSQPTTRKLDQAAILGIQYRRFARLMALSLPLDYTFTDVTVTDAMITVNVPDPFKLI